jgi:hypothetical protein
MTKTAAIYNLWDGEELLIPSMRSISDGIDLFIVVYQTVSNFGEVYNPLINLRLDEFNVILKEYTPIPNSGGLNETTKRNLGIQIAKDNDCTHFIQMDCDELYEHFVYSKSQFMDSGCDGSVARIITYFKKPTLRLKTFDNYYVPFIHKLHQNTVTGVREYPFYVDPTRRINTTGPPILISDSMHHFSWVRKNINRKIMNSSARKNILKSQLEEDYNAPNLGEGFYLKDYGQKLIEVQDLFGLSPIFSAPK